MSVQALVFDVDGTLADTEEVHRQAFNAAFARAGLGWEWSRKLYRELLGTTGGKERIARYLDGLTMEPGTRAALRASIPALHADKTRIYGTAIAEGAVALRPGIERILREAHGAGLRLAIATTTSAANVSELLQASLGDAGAGLFEVVACGDEVAAKKPAPDIYQLALAKLGLPSSAAIAFEDSTNGLRSAQAAGLWTVITPTFWSADENFASAGLVLPHLGDTSEPLPGEPGRQLKSAAWLTLAELLARHREVALTAQGPAESAAAQFTGATT
jgi:HAD superfamily hydrolase (TIGR01509 family)